MRTNVVALTNVARVTQVNGYNPSRLIEPTLKRATHPTPRDSESVTLQCTICGPIGCTDTDKYKKRLDHSFFVVLILLDGTRVMSGKKEQVIFDVQIDPRFNRVKIINYGILTIFEFAFARERAYANMNFSKN